MGKTYLTDKELKQFPTIENLIIESNGEDPNLWGLRQNDENDTDFGKASQGWTLYVTLNDILMKARVEYGKNYEADNILVFCGVDCLETTSIYLELIELSSYGENSPLYPLFDLSMLQN